MSRGALYVFLGLVMGLISTVALAQATPGFVPLNPARLLDTRAGSTTIDGTFAARGALVAGGTLNLSVLNRGGVLASGVSAVVLNVTVTNPTKPGYITVWPTGTAQPYASNLNFTPGVTIPNLVIAQVGSNGQVSLFNSAGSTDLVADVVGYFTTGSLLTPQVPVRVLDSRTGFTTADGKFAGMGALGTGATLNLTLDGRGGLPATGVGAVIMNVTATDPTANGYVSTWPTGSAQPLASTQNFVPTQTIPNLVISQIGSNGQVSFFNSAGTTDLIADVVGWFPNLSEVTPLVPARLLDTRAGTTTVDGQFVGSGALAAASSFNLTVSGRGGVPASGVGAVILNVTATNPTAPAYITVWPAGSAQPYASNLNVVAGQTIANLVIAKVGSNGQVSLFNSAGSTDLIADVVGWFPTTPDLPTNDAQAARFLTQATFGPTPMDIKLLRAIGYKAWIAKQLALPASPQRPYVESLDKAVLNPGNNDRMEAWFNNAVTAPDQLRQRMAWALSQIMVVSDQFANLGQDPIALAEYCDVLARDSAGYTDGAGTYHAPTFYNLMYDVTLSPAMAQMLTYLRNQKANTKIGTSPDENYAREAMQLFTIGLVLLNQDGSLQFDANNQPIPTYNQAVVSAYARVYTGWSYSSGFNTNPSSSTSWSTAEYLPLTCTDSYHDFGAKTLLSYTGNYTATSDAKSLPANNTCIADLQQALSILVKHPNVAPFISHQLIQQLVTSNPTPAYISRIAAKFNATNGDIGQVVAAILTDTEAMTGTIPAQYSNYVFGKAREPLLKLTALWRYYGAASTSGLYSFTNPQSNYVERPEGAQSVFNFYAPNYLPPGELGDSGMFGPQFQILSESSTVTTANDLTGRLNAYVGNTGNNATTIAIDLTNLRSLASNPSALIDQINHDLLYGTMSAATKTSLLKALNGITASNPITAAQTLSRAQSALQVVLASPEFAIQK
jgi:uncharacterized protein (DUF1800 family)